MVPPPRLSGTHVMGSPDLQMPPSGSLEKFGKPEDGAKRVPEVESAVKDMERELGERHPKVRRPPCALRGDVHLCNGAL